MESDRVVRVVCFLCRDCRIGFEILPENAYFRTMDQNQMLELKNTLERALINNGETDRLKTLLKARLHECGWTDELRIEAGRIIREQGVENTNLKFLVDELTPLAREKVPGEVKKELLHKIQTAVHTEVENIVRSAPNTYNI